MKVALLFCVLWGITFFLDFPEKIHIFAPAKKFFNFIHLKSTLTMDKNLHQNAKAPMIALIHTQALKGRPDVMHRCNPCTTKTLLMLLFLALMAAPNAFAQTIVTTRDIDGVRYTLWSDNTASVESTGPEGTPSLHTQFSGQLDFLQTISYNDADYTLTKIGDIAFSRNKNITGISIPSTVTSIGAAAFRSAALCCAGIRADRHDGRLGNLKGHLGCPF